MFILGITGGIGTGKSTVAALLREASIEVLDADEIAHAVTDKGGSALESLVLAFGPEILDQDQALNRPYLAQILFKDKKKLDAFSALVHQEVFKVMDEKIKASKAKAMALDVPIPVKEGFQDRCDFILHVTAPMELRLKRLELRGMKQSEAQRRMAVQLDEAGYKALSTHQISNDSSLEALKAKVQALLSELLGNRGIPFTPLVL